MRRWKIIVIMTEDAAECEDITSALYLELLHQPRTIGIGNPASVRGRPGNRFNRSRWIPQDEPRMTDKTHEAVDERAQLLHGAIKWRRAVIIGHV